MDFILDGEEQVVDRKDNKTSEEQSMVWVQKTNDGSMCKISQNFCQKNTISSSYFHTG